MSFFNIIPCISAVPFIIITIVFTASCARNLEDEPYYNSYAAHHDPYGFRNAHISERMKKRGLMQWFYHQLHAEADHYAPVTAKSDLELIHHPIHNDIQATWIGHATALIQHKGVNILTDPVFSDRASFLPFFGPKRKVSPGVEIDDLPDIDIVAISHNHYDHLDVRSIQALIARKQERAMIFYVPLGLKSWFKRMGLNADVREFDWWHTDKTTLGDEQPVCTTAVPAQHFSRRGLFDGNKTLWSGWVIEVGNAKIYFSGDTGYMSDFKEIGARFREIDLALVPIGAYDPRALLANMHTTPEEAVKIGVDVRARHMLPIHWGTFHLTSEPMDEPAERYLAALKKMWKHPGAAFLPAVGETISMPYAKGGRYCDF